MSRSTRHVNVQTVFSEITPVFRHGPGVPSRPRCSVTAPVFRRGPGVPSRPRCSVAAPVFRRGPGVPSRPRCTAPAPSIADQTVGFRKQSSILGGCFLWPWWGSWSWPWGYWFGSSKIVFSVRIVPMMMMMNDDDDERVALYPMRKTSVLSEFHHTGNSTETLLPEHFFATAKKRYHMSSRRQEDDAVENAHGDGYRQWLPFGDTYLELWRLTRPDATAEEERHLLREVHAYLNKVVDHGQRDNDDGEERSGQTDYKQSPQHAQQTQEPGAEGLRNGFIHFTLSQSQNAKHSHSGVPLPVRCNRNGVLQRRVGESVLSFRRLSSLSGLTSAGAQLKMKVETDVK
ncbi:hypothetical protein EYF80_017942 [Liparis tanakae]|uniref:Uncharacterized protein n=1 Tax=Liparis tanakae TaxID=230148 RepID=A0A4Z2I1X7_9TELE|nr:hypothetical protein EYF80_017942 [Liparis tanakae]